ncbi:MAG TPA: WD40 repeat domain-containing protein [Ktedonobacterales bacterium]
MRAVMARHGSLARRWRACAALGALAALLLAGCATGTARTRPSSTSVPTDAAVRVVYTFTGHGGRVTALAYRRQIASASLDGTVQLWNPATGAVARVYREHGGPVLAVAWSPDSALVASGDATGMVRVWSPASGATATVYHEHAGPITAIAWSPDGRWVASASEDGSARVWSADTGQTRTVFRGHGGQPVRTLAWSPDGMRIASGGDDATVQLWDAATGATALTYRGHSARVTSVAWSPDGKLIASGSLDKSAQVWSPAGGTLLYAWRGYRVSAPVSDPLRVLPDQVFVVAWSHDGRRLAVVTQEYCGDECGVVLTWDALTQQRVLVSTTLSLFALAWSPDDRLLAGSAGESTVQVFQALRP